MMPAAERGRRLTLAIAVFLGIVPIVLLAIAAASSSRLTQGAAIYVLLQTISGLGIFWLLFKGYRWARVYIVLLICLGTLPSIFRVLTLVPRVHTMRQGSDVLSLLTPRVLNLILAAVLWFSPSINAYFDRENESTVLSLNASNPSA